MTDSNNEYREGRKMVERETPSTARTVIIVLLWIMFAGAVIGTVGWGLGWFSEAGQVAQEQFGARAGLIKYEWFKNASAELDKKKADIVLYEDRLASFERDYGTDRTRWQRDVREQANQARTEYVGVVASHNSLAAQYNANSSKFNWAYAEGDAPRTVAEYQAK